MDTNVAAMKAEPAKERYCEAGQHMTTDPVRFCAATGHTCAPCANRKLTATPIGRTGMVHAHYA